MLQNTDPMLSDMLIEAMTRAPSDWRWFIRLHPATLKYVGDVENRLNSEGLKNFEVERPSRHSLNDQIRRVDHVVTEISTTGLDATALGTPASVMGDYGILCYDEYFKSGRVLKAESVDCLLENIASASRRDGSWSNWRADTTANVEAGLERICDIHEGLNSSSDD